MNLIPKSNFYYSITYKHRKKRNHKKLYLSNQLQFRIKEYENFSDELPEGSKYYIFLPVKNLIHVYIIHAPTSKIKSHPIPQGLHKIMVQISQVFKHGFYSSSLHLKNDNIQTKSRSITKEHDKSIYSQKVKCIQIRIVRSLFGETPLERKQGIPNPLQYIRSIHIKVRPISTNSERMHPSRWLLRLIRTPRRRLRECV